MSCDKAYTRNDHLQRHLMTHTGERKFQVCAHTYTYTHLHVHIHTHTRARARVLHTSLSFISETRGREEKHVLCLVCGLCMRSCPVVTLFELLPAMCANITC